jgi:D-3-phosphoglycerate dehydrogenase / 2-oxoglutarate reductase
MRYKILNTIGKKYTSTANSILDKIGDVKCLDISQRELEDKISEYDILVVGLGLNITKKVIDNGKNLKIIATATTGLDHIDIEYARKKNIIIVSLRGENEFLNTITGTAELAFGLVIDLLRLTPHSFDSVKKYEWDRESFRGHNLYGQTLGIVGLGRLGSWMAKYGNAFGMNVIGSDPYVDKEVFDKCNCEKVYFSELLERSDIISIHVHLNDETEKMFDINAIDTMKDTARLINTSRGRIVDEDKIL